MAKLRSVIGTFFDTFFGKPSPLKPGIHRDPTPGRSRQDRRDDRAGDVGQAVLAAVVEVGEAGVFEAEEVEDRGVQVVDVHAVGFGAEADGVGGAEEGAPLDAAAGEPGGEAVGVVVAAGAALGHGHAAELAAPDDEGAVEQAAAFQVGEQGGDGLVGLGAHGGVVGFDVVVRVPAGEVAGVELNEADPALDEAAGEEASGAEVGGDGVVEAVEAAGGGGLAGEVDGLGGGGLHPVGEFVRLDAGGEVGVVGAGFEVAGVEGADEVEHPALFGASQGALGGPEVEQGIIAGSDDGPLVARREEAVAVGGGAPFEAAGGVGHDDEGGEIAILGSQSVADPRAEAGPTHEDRAGVHLVDGLGVVDAVGPAGADDGEVVDASGRVGQEVGDGNAAVAVRAEGAFRAEQGVLADLAAGGDGAEALGEGITVQALEVGLGVEGFEVAGPAVHEEVDDRVGLRGEVGGLRGEGVSGRVGIRLREVLLQHPGQGEEAESAAGVAEEGATGRRGGDWVRAGGPEHGGPRRERTIEGKRRVSRFQSRYQEHRPGDSTC